MKTKELHKIAPTLSKIITKESGFQVPKNYFDTIEDNVLAEIITSKFNKDSANRNFKTPENYFETLEDLVITKLKVQAYNHKKDISIPENYFDTIEDQVFAQLKRKSKIITLKKAIKYVIPIAIAASFLLIFLLKNNSNTVTFESIASSEIEAFIESGNIEYDAESLILAFPNIELETSEFISTLSDSEVINYLNNHDLDDYIYED